MGYLTALVADKLQLTKLVVIVVVVLAILGAFGWQKHQKDAAVEAQQQAEKARDTAIEDLGALKIVNQTNQDTIKQLKSEQALRDKIQYNLKKQIEKDQIQMNDLASYISSTGPKDDASIAPVLKKTLDSIQNLRDQRAKAGETK